MQGLLVITSGAEEQGRGDSMLGPAFPQFLRQGWRRSLGLEACALPLFGGLITQCPSLSNTFRHPGPVRASIEEIDRSEHHLSQKLMENYPTSPRVPLDTWGLERTPSTRIKNIWCSTIKFLMVPGVVLIPLPNCRKLSKTKSESIM